MFTGNTAQQYDSWYETKRGKFIDQTETEAAFNLISVPPGAKILDAGCGTGNFSLKLSQSGYDVAGIDLSPDMLQIARKKARQQKADIDFKVMNICELSFPDNYFDAVFSMAAFEFIAEPETAYKELYRVVKPGGQILIGTINRDSPWGQAYMEEAARDNTSVFKKAFFMNLEELSHLDQNNFIAGKECLFIPPQAPEDHFTPESENHWAQHTRGGFIICLWQKPAI